MKKLFTAISLIFLMQFTSAQCISGNCENGTGMFKYKSGNTYEGYFKNGNIDKLGVFYYSNGTTLWGEINDAKFNGFGVIYFKNGASYIGNLKNGVQDGLGIFYNDNKIPHSAGTWTEGKLTIAASIDSTNSNENCVGNCENGFGKLKLPNKTILQGIFNNGILVFGTIQNKEYAYSGNIKNNLANGIGIIEYYNGKKHLGYFKDNKKHGTGIYTSGITLKRYGIWKNDIYKGLESYHFNEKHFCNELADLCDMSYKELNQMQVQKEELFGNLWKYKFLHHFNIYHNQIKSSKEIVFINFSNTKGVGSKDITKLLSKCQDIKSTYNLNTYESKGVVLELTDKDNVLMLQLTYPITSKE